MSGELNGRVALVTGAARNIGRAIALALAEGGAKVMATALSNQAGLDEVVGAIRAAGGEAEAMLADVTSEESVAALIKGRSTASASSTSSSTTPPSATRRRSASSRWRASAR